MYSVIRHGCSEYYRKEKYLLSARGTSGRRRNVFRYFFRAWSVDERQNIFWILNLYADYMYHFNHWLSAGLQVNTTWNGGKSRKRDQEDAVWHSYLYGVVTFMPTIRFTYFHTDKNHVALYSALHAGYGVGIDKTGYEGSGFTGGMTALGISFSGEHLFGAF